MKKLYSLLFVLVALVAIGAYQTVNVGSNPNDGTGDTLRSAFQKVNANFTQVTADFVSATNYPGYGAWLTNWDSRLLFFTNGVVGGNVFQWSFNGVDQSLELDANGFTVFTNFYPGWAIIQGQGGTNIMDDTGSSFNDMGVTNAGVWLRSNIFRGPITINSSGNSTLPIIIGNSAALNSGSLSRSIHLGALSGSSATNSTSSLFFGFSSGQNAYNSANSLFIGRESGFNSSNSSQSILIGTYSGRNSGNLTNRLLIHASSSAGADPGTNALIYGEFNNRLLRVNGSLEVTNTVTATNFIHTTWKWVDMLTSGNAVASNPSGSPPTLTEIPGQNYFGYAYYWLNGTSGDRSYFSIQSPHKFSTTNEANPNFYFEPHMHVMCTNMPINTSNATFRLDLYYGRVWGQLTNYYVMTNTMSFTNIYQHGVLDFGNVTNNLLSGRASIIYHGRIMRLPGGDGDLGNNNPVWVESIDIHVPVTELGTTGQFGDN